MPLVRNSYGKGRVRLLRVHRDGDYNEVRELNIKVMLDGDFDASYTAGDNRQVVATDTIKNIVYIVAHDHLADGSEAFVRALGQRYLDRYPHVRGVSVSALETKWPRLEVGGKPHPHAFLLDANGQNSVQLDLTRESEAMSSGVKGFTFMKSTAAGWVKYYMDDATTLKETTDRIVATSMDATWAWSSPPPDYAAANATVLGTAMEVFATTYSYGVQDSLYRMGEAVLEAVPQISSISMACPNKHYLPMNMAPFGLDAKNCIFVPTDEPHGQIECTVGRG
jgi:urate oxidase